MGDIMTTHNRYVRVHCGSAHVKGRARMYRYYIASLFTPVLDGKGRVYYHNAGISTEPRRSRKLVDQDATRLAQRFNARVIPGYGSLHNQRPSTVRRILDVLGIMEE
jgi:hypothetical protein